MKNIYVIHFNASDYTAAYTTYDAAKLELIKDYLDYYTDECNQLEVGTSALIEIIKTIIDYGGIEDYAYINPTTLYGE